MPREFDTSITPLKKLKSKSPVSMNTMTLSEYKAARRKATVKKKPSRKKVSSK
jgi:hypothetical protein